MTQMLELTNKDFKTPTIHMYNNLKEIVVIRNESIWKINWEMNYIKGDYKTYDLWNIIKS